MLAWFAGGVAFVLAAAAALIATDLWVSRRSALAEVKREAETGARLLAELASRSLDGAAAILTFTGDAVTLEGIRSTPVAELSDLLRTYARTAPPVRSLSFIDAARATITDSGGRHPFVPDQAWADLARQLTRRPAAAAIGQPAPGRDFGADVPAAGAAPIHHIPMARLTEPDSPTSSGVVVAALNPDHFATLFGAVPVRSQAVLRILHYDGRLIATSEPTDGPVGATLAMMPIFTGFLPNAEHGTYRDLDRDESDRITAFRVLPRYPIVVSVGIAVADGLADWWQRAVTLIVVGIAALAVFAGAIAVSWRHLRTLHLQQRALAESEALKSAMLATAHDAVVGMDHHGRIVEFNATAERIFQRRRAHVLGRPLAEMIVPPPMREAHTAGLARFLRTGQIHVLGRRLELSAMRADGSTFMAEIAITATSPNAQPVFTAYIRDITERHRQEEELRAAHEQADAANRAKSEFLATISHEIRTPMNGIIGTLSVVEDSNLSANQRRQLRTVGESAASLLRLINDLLDFARLEEGRVALEAERFDIAEIVEGIVELVAPLAQAKALSLSWTRSDPLPARVRGDSGRLRQILLNLLSNAIKFTSQGSVTLAITATPADAGRVDVRFTVTDTGIGIATEAQARIFDRFEQVDASITRRFGGTGLGLSIVKRLADLMQGEVGLSSSPGAGSTFWVRLTLDVDESSGVSTSEAPVDVPAAGIPPLQILLAEDNPTNQEVVSTILRSLGHRVEVVGNGREAVAAASERPFDLVLMDIQMPEMSGVEATAEIRRLAPPRHQVPIIAVTAMAQPSEHARYLSAGMSAVVVKPLTRSSLARALSAVERPLEATEAPVPVNDAGEAGINEDTLADLRDAVGDEATQRHVRRFLTEARTMFGGLQNAMQGADLDAMRQLAHSLAGSLRTFGADRLADLASEADVASQAGDRDATMRACSQLLAEYPNTLELLDKRFA